MTLSDVYNLYKTVAAYIGSVRSAVMGKGNQPAVTLTATNMSLQGNTRASIPMCSPYGFISVPLDYVQAVVINTGVSRNNAIALTTIPVLPPEWTHIPNYSPGEGGIYSPNYAVSTRTSSVQYGFKNPLGNFQATAISGENANIIMMDLINAFTLMANFLNEFVDNYNAHEHSVPGISTGLSTVETTGNTNPQPEYGPPQYLEQDAQAIQQGQTLISDSGISPFRS